MADDTSSPPPARPLLVFDGDCGFCTASVHWLEARFRREVDVEPYQALDLDALGLTEAGVTRYAWWLDAAERRSPGAGVRDRGHRAIARGLRACGGLWPLVGGLLLLPPPFSWLYAAGYRLTARYRGWLPGTTPACRMRSDGE